MVVRLVSIHIPRVVRPLYIFEASSFLNESSMMHLHPHRPLPQQMNIILKIARLPKLHMRIKALPPCYPHKRLPLLPRPQILMLHVLNDPSLGRSLDPFCLLFDNVKEFVDVLLVGLILRGENASQDFGYWGGGV